MKLVVRGSLEESLQLPARLMEQWNLADGQEVQVQFDQGVLAVAPLKAFLALKGRLAEDEAFDAALQTLEHGWQAWTPSA